MAQPLEIKVSNTFLDLSFEKWRPLQQSDFPFTDLEFLQALESANCLGDRTGWHPCSLLAWDGDFLAGALILFLKVNSYGEYIFDFNWAQAAEAAHIPYYPKLVSAIPFTPATGSKLLVHPDYAHTAIAETLLKAAQSAVHKLDCHSLHFLFLPESELLQCRENSMFLRSSFQYHWRNQNYQSFEDFLSALTSKRRRETRRERKQVAECNLSMKWLTGESLTDHHATVMHKFYVSTLDKMGGHEYLTEDFFHLLFKTMKDRLLLVLAVDETGREVAGALNFRGQKTLYGRYWGCLAEYRALHFELCYYQGIEYCIQHGLELFEAGAQGEHKFQRGFLPALTSSAHMIQHPGLSDAIQKSTTQEKLGLKSLFDSYAAHSPFSQG